MVHAFSEMGRYLVIQLKGFFSHDNRGHYASFIEILNSKSWLHCNDTAVLRADENKIKNTSSYIYFYESHSFFLISLCKWVWISFLVFRCDDTTCNPSPCVFCFVRGFGYLPLSLCVTTLHVIPDALPCMVKMLLHWWWFAPTA